jgi:two-component system, OmpR family, heavy metal sensor histidine kinase CusS
VLRTMLRERPDDTDALREEVELETAARRYEHFYIRLLDERNTPLMTTPGMAEEIDLSQLAQRTRGHPDVSIPMKGSQGQAFRVTTAGAQVGSTPGHTITVQIAIDVSQKEAFLARFRLVFWVIVVGTLAIFPLVGYQIARQGIRPVEEMAATARRISSTHLGERILTEGYPFELASLAGTFNEMLDRLEDSFDRISKFSADIAHDLRTPVNNIRGEAEVALARARGIDEYRDALESSLEEAVRLSDLIGNLLFLARAESPLAHLRRERVDVAELLDGVQEYYEASAADGGISLSTRFGDEPVIAELDRTLMQRAVGNLVSNAVAHTQSGGSVVIAASSGSAVVRIEVTDTGIGIPPEALPRVFDRFFRVDPSRSQVSGGTGLGLAIVQGIMLLHGGKVEIASQPGKGTRVILSLPASAATMTNV